MDQQTSDVRLLRGVDDEDADGGTSVVDLGVGSGFSLTALCNNMTNSALSVEGAASIIPTDAEQSMTVVQDSSTVSVTELINSLPTSSGLPPGSVNGGQTLQWAGLGDAQSTIITFTALPFVEGGQEMAITEACLPPGVTLETADLTSQVQSLIAQGASIKRVESEKAGGLDSGQLLDFGSGGVGALQLGGPAGVQLGSDCGDLVQPVVVAATETNTTPPVFTDDTQIFTRVCATLNADVMSCVPGSREVLLDSLSQEENAQLGIDEQQHLTLEASLHTVTRIHNALKDLLNLPCCSKLTFTPDPASPPPSRAMEEKGVSCRLLLPFVSSKGRHIKLPAHMPAVINDKDAFNSDDSDFEVKPPRQRRKGRPRKMVAVGSVIHRNNFQPSSREENALGGDICPTNGGNSGVKTTDEISKPSAADAYDVENKVAETIVDPSQQLGVLRKARSMSHVSHATRMRRIYEGRIKYKFFCDKCSFKSKRDSHYRKHMKLHEGSVEVHTCAECQFKTIRLSHLRRHELLHKQSLVKCTLCGYMTDGSRMLLKHMKLKHPNGRTASATPQQIFRCDQCDHTTSSRGQFARHMLTHSQGLDTDAAGAGMEGYQCRECSRTFQRRVHLDRHLRDVHGPGLRPHLCDICGKSFKRSDALQQHKVVHTDHHSRSYAFHCARCNKGFRSQAHLKEHLTMHSTDRPYLCDYCGSAFKTQAVQRKHILSLHERPRAHHCSLCTKKFNTPYALRRHARTHEAEAQKLAAQNSVQVTTIPFGLDGDDTGHLDQMGTEAAVVAVADAAEALHVQQPTLTAGMEEAMEQGETLQTQYIVQGNETATALFYLTGSL